MDNTLCLYSYGLLFFLLIPLLCLAKCNSPSNKTSHSTVRLPPGPWQLPVIGSLHHLLSAHPHHSLHLLSRHYGCLMFLKLGEVPLVVVSSREGAKEVMKTHDLVFATRPQTVTIKILTKRSHDIALAPYGDPWRHLRKICVFELLSNKRVQSFQPIREEEVARLIHDISSSSSPLVNISALVSAYVTDSIVRAIMGRRLKDRDTFMRYVDGAIHLVNGFTLADLFPSSRLIRALSWKAQHKVEVYIDGLLKYLDCVISEHKEKRSHEEALQEDLIDALLRIQNDNPSHHLSMGTIKGVIFDLFAAGSESSSTTLQWAMTELMRNPIIMSRAQNEVREAFKGSVRVHEEGLDKLNYLHWIIKETLRLHIPGPLLLPRECRENCKVLGYDVPKGTMLLVNAWAISRDPQYWEEPETFKPERFESDTRDYKGNDFEFTAFGAGRRICPGMSFGLATVKLALANLLFCFDWSLPEGMSPNELDMTEVMGITLRRKRDLWLRATMHSN